MIKATWQKLFLGSSKRLDGIGSETVHLVVTSPPYPMIELWDNMMIRQNPLIKTALEESNGPQAFELMHQELDLVWQELERVLIPGGLVCINIGDAARTMKDDFALYSNHARIIEAFLRKGFVNLPPVIWRKQTNAPTKFMGSGMLPAGAYVTLEHEWILIFRKGGKRKFLTSEQKKARQESAFFWEERNSWFSDLWDFKGVRQQITAPESRDRTASFPFMIPYRLINMYSAKGDIVLDPFAGTGTTMIATLSCQRNGIAVEIDPSFYAMIHSRLRHLDLTEINGLIDQRIQEHKKFVAAQEKEGRVFLHANPKMNVGVMTGQEKALDFHHLLAIVEEEPFHFQVKYKKDFA